MKYFNTVRPQLILDEFRCKRNIQRMTQKATKLKIKLRPHFKTHQSLEIGRWFREEGIKGITVSSVDMASYFASDGWDDITIAFPFYPLQIPALYKLEKKASLRLFVNRIEDLELISKNLHRPFKVILEIDPGFGRSGIHYQNHNLIEDLIQTCDRLDNCSFYGFYTHDGRTYQSTGIDQIRSSIMPVIGILTDLKRSFPQASLLMGDTPSTSVLNDFGPIDELSPGNFVFYDWMQVQIGSCNIDDVALFCSVPVAQVIGDGSAAIVHGGAVHLSKDSLVINGNRCFGQVINYSEKIITVETNSYLSALSQEHGTVNTKQPKLFENETLWICPIHSCLTANLHDHYLTTTGKIIDKRILS